MLSSEIQGDDQSGGVSVESSSDGPNAGRYRPKVQFKVARNTVTNTTELGTARLRTGPGQHWEDHVVAGLKLGGSRQPEPIDLRLGRG